MLFKQRTLILLLFITTAILECLPQNKTKSSPASDTTITYYLLKPGDTEFEIEKKNVPADEIKGNYYQKRYYVGSMLVKIEHHDTTGGFTEAFSYAAIVEFKYLDGKVKQVKLYDKNQERKEDEFYGW